MSKEQDARFLGMVIPLTEHQGSKGETVELTDHDISRLEGVNPLYRTMRATFKDQLGKPYLVGAEIRVGLLATEGEIAYTPSRVLADQHTTAQQLTANAQREEPRPLSKVLDHPGLGKVLEALSATHRKAGTCLILRTEDGDCAAPIMGPNDFIEPLRSDHHRQTGSFLVTGLRRNLSNGFHGVLLGNTEIPVALPAMDPRWDWTAIRGALDVPTYLVGTLTRTSKAAAWMPLDDARLESQAALPGLDQGTGT